MNDKSSEGIVYLVGAGPGDPDLITVKGNQLLQGCDVVVYDNLVPIELVTTLPDHVDRRYVGKKAGKHTLDQAGINDLLVELASKGKKVVRLKGGDPFVVGRGGEEARYLKDHDVRYEIVPGVTAGVAATAYAGIPCTDRRAASFVVFLTGHRAEENAVTEVPWNWVGKAKNGTLVVYMGVSETENVVGQLIGAGMSPQTPVAVIERGTLPTQRTLRSTLIDLTRSVRNANIRPPALFVIGEVVDLQDELSWFSSGPLSGLRIMVTRPADQAREMYRSLRELGAEVLPYPTISTHEETDETGWAALQTIDTDQRWIVFTSENGVRYFLKTWQTRMGDVRRMAGYKIAAVGNGTARALKANRITADFVPTKATTAALAQQMVEQHTFNGATVVRVRGNLGSRVVEDTLEKAGATVIPLSVYKTTLSDWTNEAKAKLFAYPPDVIIFTSGSTVDGLVRNLDKSELARLTGESTIVSIGPSTSETIRSAGLSVGLESRVHAIPALIEELIAFHMTSPIKRTQ